VRLRVDGDRRTLSVEHDGLGIDRAVVDEPETLGMRLIEALSRQIDGSLEVESEPRRGTRFALRF
jgi:two-component sensor histidine kinase